MADEVKAYVTYVKTSFSDIVKALLLVLLIATGPLLAAALRVGGIDGWTILYVGTIEELIMFIIIFLLGKKGIIFKNLRQEEFQKSPKKGQAASEEPKAED